MPREYVRKIRGVLPALITATDYIREGVLCSRLAAGGPPTPAPEGADDCTAQREGAMTEHAALDALRKITNRAPYERKRVRHRGSPATLY